MVDNKCSCDLYIFNFFVVGFSQNKFFLKHNKKCSHENIRQNDL